MTAEKAIRILDPRTSLLAMAECEATGEWLKLCNEACRMGADALRAQQTPDKLDRSRWEGCNECENLVISRKMVGLGRRYCPYCGRTLTKAAWAELERRIGGNDGTADN